MANTGQKNKIGRVSTHLDESDKKLSLQSVFQWSLVLTLMGIAAVTGQWLGARTLDRLVGSRGIARVSDQK